MSLASRSPSASHDPSDAVAEQYTSLSRPSILDSWSPLWCLPSFRKHRVRVPDGGRREAPLLRRSSPVFGRSCANASHTGFPSQEHGRGTDYALPAVSRDGGAKALHRSVSGRNQTAMEWGPQEGGLE